MRALIELASQRLAVLYGRQSGRVAAAWRMTGIADNPILLADLSDIARFQSGIDPATGRVLSEHELTYLTGRRDAVNDILARCGATEDDINQAIKEIEHAPLSMDGFDPNVPFGTRK